MIFPYPNETNYNQRLGAWLISNELSPYQKPECLPEPYPDVPPYKHPTNYQSVSNTLNYEIQRSRNASNCPPVWFGSPINVAIEVLKDHEMRLDRFSDQEKTVKDLKVKLAERSGALAAGLEATNSTVTNVAAKVEEQGEKLIRVEAELSEKTAAFRKITAKSRKQRTTIRKLKTDLTETQEKVAAISGQLREAQAKAEEDKIRQQHEFEQQMREMNDKFREMQMQMMANQEKQQEMKKQLNDHQLAQARLEVVNARDDLQNREKEPGNSSSSI